MSSFKTLKKGDLVTVADDGGDTPSYIMSLNAKGFILGEIERGSTHAWGYCKVHVIVQSKDLYNINWITTIRASQLAKVELYKVKKKRGKRKASPASI